MSLPIVKLTLVHGLNSVKNKQKVKKMGIGYNAGIPSQPKDPLEKTLKQMGIIGGVGGWILYVFSSNIVPNDISSKFLAQILISVVSILFVVSLYILNSGKGWFK